MSELPLNLRAQLAQVLHDMRTGRGSGLELLPRLDRQLADPRDRALARAMLFATLRGIERYERWLSDLLERPIPGKLKVVESVLLLALASLDLGIDAEHAVVSASVDAVRQLKHPTMAGLANAVLRRTQRELARLRALPPANAAEQHNHPAWLIDLLVRDWGQAQAELILAANNRPGPLCLRVNRQRTTRSDYLARLQTAGRAARAPDDLPDALLLDDSVDVHSLPGFDEGDVSVQDGAAQLALSLLAPAAGDRVLDACAAPGGKLAHIAEQGLALTRLLACDVSPPRLKRMQQNMERLGFGEHIEWREVDAGHAKAFADDERFERILLDAPCTGTGVIRRHPDIRLLRQPDQLRDLKRTQARLLDRLFPLLAPGGRLVYATCSVLAEENAGQIAAFLKRHTDARLLPVVPEWFGRDTGFGRQILPGEHELDGFFYAVLTRT
ncbi:MAG: 16S rRNA (cytosine(967)-C(5))-methyltransferase RsmB [Ahniella sp.]|nr:16S rRNA (cytosine(967)-C(5))-methyltransferase RsmB [Ahniella sp.]